MKSKSVHDPMQTIATMLGYGAKSFERTRMSTDACDPNYRLRVAAFDGLCHLTEEGMTSNAPTALQLAGPPRRFFVMTEEEALWLHGALGEVLEEHAAHEAKEKECQVAPAGWRCTRAAGHEGPCAAVAIEDEELSVWTHESPRILVVAATVKEAKAIAVKTGYEEDELSLWECRKPDEKLTINDEEEGLVTKTCAEWVKEGRGMLASEDQ